MTSPREPYYDDLSYDSINKLLNLQPTELSSQEYDKLEQTGASYLELQVRKSVGHLASSIPDPAERVNTVRVALSWHFRDLTDEDVDKIYTRQPSLPYAPFRSLISSAISRTVVKPRDLSIAISFFASWPRR
jgi:hypothetical protein